MSDSIVLNPGSGGQSLATDVVGARHHQLVKPVFGEDGTVTQVSAVDPLPVSNASSGTQNHGIFRYLDDVGDGSGVINANGDYSASQGIFRIAPAAGQIFRISRMIVMVEDTSGFTPVEYGNTASALTNGIQVRCHNGVSTVCDFTNSHPIKFNGDWAGRCYDADLKTWGSSNEMLVVRWTFTKGGQFVRIDGDANEEFQVVLDDDLSGLINHTFYINGYIENDPT